MEIHPAEGVMKEKFPNIRKPSHPRVCGEFWNFGGQHNQKEKRKENPQIMCLAVTSSREVAQTLELASREQGLNREVGVTFLR